MMNIGESIPVTKAYPVTTFRLKQKLKPLYFEGCKFTARLNIRCFSQAQLKTAQLQQPIVLPYSVIKKGAVVDKAVVSITVLLAKMPLSALMNLTFPGLK